MAGIEWKKDIFVQGMKGFWMKNRRVGLVPCEVIRAVCVVSLRLKIS